MALIVITACSDTTTTTPTEPTESEVTIGSQTWMTRNLDVAFFRNGDSIPEARTNAAWVQAASEQRAAWCYYNNDPANGKQYGKLYNWYAVHDPRGLAPTGMRVATLNDWQVLVQELGGGQQAGLHLKASVGWANVANGNNSSGFWAVPGGARDNDNFGLLGTFASIWTSTDDDSLHAWHVILSSSGKDVLTYSQEKSRGRSVRCIKQ